MRTALFSILLLCLFSSTKLLAQIEGDATGVKSYSALSARVLAIDYAWPNDLEDLDNSFGIELAYRRQLGKAFGLALPFKAGVIDVGELENSTFVSLDLLGHLYPFGSSKKLAPYFLAGGGIVQEISGSANTQIPLGAGLNLHLGANSFLSLQAEYRLSDQEGRDNFQLGLGYIYRLVPTDGDGDGIIDSEDECPTEPGDLATKGCPDTDGDGIPNHKDKCPNVAGLSQHQGCPDTDGDGVMDSQDACPEEAGPASTQGCPDTDGDGVADKDDACPNATGSPNQQGCPDTDGDGIYDHLDKCPQQAGPASNEGCPLADADGDGIPDAEDRCPNQAGSAQLQGCPDTDGDGIPDPDDKCPTQAGLASNQGCPEIEEEVVKILEFATQAVQFETGSARLKPESFLTLDEIARIMREYPAYSLVIAGHTDNIGNAENNQVLSENRARACKDYLIEAGIPSRRMTHIGYGQNQARADNSTASGRRLNRRVEFNLRLL